MRLLVGLKDGSGGCSTLGVGCLVRTSRGFTRDNAITITDSHRIHFGDTSTLGVHLCTSFQTHAQNADGYLHLGWHKGGVKEVTPGVSQAQKQLFEITLIW